MPSTHVLHHHCNLAVRVIREAILFHAEVQRDLKNTTFPVLCISMHPRELRTEPFEWSTCTPSDGLDVVCVMQSIMSKPFGYRMARAPYLKALRLDGRLDRRRKNRFWSRRRRFRGHCQPLPKSPLNTHSIGKKRLREIPCPN